MKIGKIIPQPLKNLILRIIRIPERIKVRIYQAAAHGKIPFPDKAFQKWDYKIHTGRKLNIHHPVTFQEKLQWMKYYYRNPELTKLVDKYEVRDYVRGKIGEEYLVPLYGVYNKWDEIDFSALPDEFVIKCTHDSGSVVICKNKNTFDYESAKKKIEAGLARNQFYLSREWPYKNVKPRIIIEKYLEDDLTGDLPDYKFFCFDGKVKILESNTERQSIDGTKTDFYSPDFELIKMKEKGYPNSNKVHSKPIKFDEMKELAEQLSAKYPFIRVDFNYADNSIYFGELTLYHCGGRMMFEPDEYNKTIGDWITLPQKIR